MAQEMTLVLVEDAANRKRELWLTPNKVRTETLWSDVQLIGVEISSYLGHSNRREELQSV
jgi:hypothetical protein